MPLFLSARAAIRTHVALARGKLGDDACAEARALLDQAIAHLAVRKPRLVAIGGFSGSGKSTLAYALAPAISPSPGAVVIRSDITRKALFGCPETARLPQAVYSSELHARVFSIMADRARTALKSGFSVILDGVYGSTPECAEAGAAARDSGTPFQGLWLETGPAILQARIEARRGDASDASVAVLRRQLETLIPPCDWIRIEANGSASETERAARTQLAALPS
jgi:uncharacterized protein